MKDSGVEWIGMIPEEWDRVSLLNTLSTKITDGPHETPELVENGVPFISVDSLNDSKRVDLSVVKKFISEELYQEYYKKASLEEGDILFSKSATIGKTAIVDDRKFMVWSPLAILKVNHNCCSTNYIYYVLNCEQLIEYTCLLGTSNTQVNVGMRALEKAKIPLPSYQEQNRIADYLDAKCAAIDDVIAKTTESIEEYKKLKQAVITEVVTKGVRGKRPMKDSGIDWIGQIPKEWDVVALRYLGQCQNGISKGAEFFGSGYPFVSYSDVYKNIELPKSVDGLVQSTDEERERYSVKRGDIFFTRTSETIEEIGFTSVCTKDIENATFAGFLIRVRPIDDSLNPDYAKYYFRSDIHRRYFVKEMIIVIRASLGQELLKKLPVLLPSKEEQREIADYLDSKCAAIDTLISKKQQFIDELTAYKKSLIYEYVTGKKECINTGM